MKTDEAVVESICFVIVGFFKLLLLLALECPDFLFCLVLSDEGPNFFRICCQTFSNDVVNVTVIGCGHFFGGFFS